MTSVNSHMGEFTNNNVGGGEKVIQSTNPRRVRSASSECR